MADSQAYSAQASPIQKMNLQRFQHFSNIASVGLVSWKVDPTPIPDPTFEASSPSYNALDDMATPPTPRQVVSGGLEEPPLSPVVPPPVGGRVLVSEGARAPSRRARFRIGSAEKLGMEQNHVSQLERLPRASGCDSD